MKAFEVASSGATWHELLCKISNDDKFLMVKQIKSDGLCLFNIYISTLRWIYLHWGQYGENSGETALSYTKVVFKLQENTYCVLAVHRKYTQN